MEKLSDMKNESSPNGIPNAKGTVKPDQIEADKLTPHEQDIMHCTSNSNVIKTEFPEKESVEKEDIDDEKTFLFDTLHLINEIVQEIEALRNAIEEFGGSSTEDKEYRYLEEMMIRGTVKLDNIETKENLLIRQERKRGVQYIQKLMRLLDSRLKENVRNIDLCSETTSDDDM